MEELFDNIFVLVPVALLIFLRVFADGVRKRSEKAKEAAGTPTPEQARPSRDTTPTEKSRTAGRTTRKEQRQIERKQRLEKREETEKARSARPAKRDLFGRLKNYLSGSLEQLVDQPEPLHFEEEASRRLGQYGTQAAVTPGNRVKVASGYKEGIYGVLEQSAAVVHEPAVRYTIPERLERLPPLKRAIVLSEVLGKPKSLQPEAYGTARHVD